MIIGIPKEVKPDEYRVAITPAGVRELTRPVMPCWSRAGPGWARLSPMPSSSATGAKIVDDPDAIWAESDMVLGVKEPIPEEYPRLGPAEGAGPVHLPPPGRVTAVHRRLLAGGQYGHRL